MLVWLLTVMLAAAGPRTVVKSQVKREVWSFDVAFQRTRGKSEQVSFTVSREAMDGALEAPPVFPKKDAARAGARAINQLDVSPVRLEATAMSSGSVKMGAYGGTGAQRRRALRRAEETWHEAQDVFARERGFFEVRKGQWAPDHVADVVEAAPWLGDAARALSQGTRGPRDRAAKVLGLVQGIRYERSGPAKDKYRSPLATLGKKKGDCDAKVALYLSLLRASDPSLETAVVYVKGHAFAALALPPKPGDKVMRVDGRSWVVVEPVGPAAMPIGQAGRSSLRKVRVGWSRVRPVRSGS